MRVENRFRQTLRKALILAVLALVAMIVFRACNSPRDTISGGEFVSPDGNLTIKVFENSSTLSRRFRTMDVSYNCVVSWKDRVISRRQFAVASMRFDSVRITVEGADRWQIVFRNDGHEAAKLRLSVAGGQVDWDP